MPRAKKNIRIGMSGWTYPPWRGGFYPKGLVQKRELEYASRQVNSIEINGTFYSLQKPTTFEKWFAQTPEEFCFAVKGPQYVTHIKRLKDVQDPVANFFASGLLALRHKLGPILWQFPPNVTLKDDRFEKFLKLLPFDSKAAARLAKKHTDKMAERNYTQVDGDYAIRHAFEFRHPSFQNADFTAMMRAHGAAIVVAHAGEKSPYIEELTADFVYCRMHGEGKDYKKGYPEKLLRDWAKQAREWSAKQDVYVYFDTEIKKYSPQDAINLAKLLT